MIWLLDTNTIIYAQHLAGNVRERLDDASSRGRIATSILVIAELLYGAERSGRPDANRNKIEQIIRTVEVLPVTVDTARRFATLKQQLVSRGKGRRELDLKGSLASVGPPRAPA